MLRHEVAEERQARRTLTIGVGIIGVGVIVAVLVACGVGLLLLQQRHIVEQNRDTIAHIVAIQHDVVECTTPDDPTSPTADGRVHECYDQAQRQQAAAVQRIIAGIVAGVRGSPPPP